MAAPSMGEFGRLPCFEYIEPAAQAAEAIARIITPTGSTRPEPPRFFGPTSNARPAKPRINPAITRGTGRVPPGRSQSINTIHRDTVATNSAATPEGTVRSARHTPPLPITRSKQPVMNAARQLAALGRTPVFQRIRGYRMTPVAKWRDPARNSGGIDSM